MGFKEGIEFEERILAYLHSINDKLHRIMGIAEDLQAKVTEVQAALDDLQAKFQAHLDQDTATIQGLNDQVAALQALLAQGATAEQLQPVIDSLNALKDDITATAV